VVVLAREIELSASAPNSTSYAFGCPLCLAVQTRSCTAAAARLLLLGGARTAPVPEESRAVAGPTLSLDHIDELRGLLDRPDWLTVFRDADE
jgi:hypothetical protein